MQDTLKAMLCYSFATCQYACFKWVPELLITTVITMLTVSKARLIWLLSVNTHTHAHTPPHTHHFTAIFQENPESQTRWSPPNSHTKGFEARRFYKPDALPIAQPTASRHWKTSYFQLTYFFNHCYSLLHTIKNLQNLDTFLVFYKFS